MKNCLIRFAAVILFSFPLFAQQSDVKQNQIVVTGSVEIKETADHASFYFSVKGVGESLREAVDSADNITKKVTESLVKLGVKKENISTSDFISTENYGDKSFLASKKDYTVKIITSVRTDSLSRLRDLLFAVNDAGVDRISNVTFSRKDEPDLKKRALPKLH